MLILAWLLTMRRWLEGRAAGAEAEAEVSLVAVGDGVRRGGRMVWRWDFGGKCWSVKDATREEWWVRLVV